MSVEAERDIDPGDDEEIVAPEGEGAEHEEEAEQPQSVEDVARSLGWKPQREWKGNPPPNGFATAAEFIARQVSGAERSRKEVQGLRKQVSGMQAMNRESLARQRQQIEANYKRVRADIVKEGGDDAAKRIDELDEQRDQALERVKAPPVDENIEAEEIAETIAQSPLASRFFGDNLWLLEEDDEEAVDMFNWCGQTFDKLIAEGVPRSAAYRKLEADLKGLFPHRYAQGQKQEEERRPAPAKDPKTGQFVRVPVMQQPGRGGGRQSWASRLPAEVRKVAQDDVKEGLFADMEEYARVYFRNQGEKVDG